MSGKTNADDQAQTPDTGTPTGDPSEPQGEAPQTPPAITPAPLHEHPDFKDRMAQAQRAGQRALLTALGYEAETPEDMARAQQEIASLLDDARQQREARLTAEERHAEQVSALTSERDRLQRERDEFKQATETAEQALADFKADLARGAAVEVVAASAGASRPADVVMWLRANRAAALTQIVGEDGAVDDEQLTALVDACREARPEWFVSRTPGSPSHDGAKAPAAPSTDQAKMDLARQQARRGMR